MEKIWQRKGPAAGSVLSRLLFCCGAMVLLIIAWQALVCLMEKVTPRGGAADYVAVDAAAGLLLTAGLALLGVGLGRMKERTVCLLLLAIALAVRWTAAVLVDTEPVSDFRLLYDAARELAQGHNLMNESVYFQRWSYQSGFVAWMALLMKLFGTDILVQKLANGICSALCVVLVYKLARRFASRSGAAGAALLYAAYPGTWLLVPVLTNQHLAECLLLASIYVYTARAWSWRKKLALAVMAGVLLALSNAIRPAMVVVVAAVAAAVVLEVLESWGRWGKIRVLLVRTLLVIAVYTALGAGLSGLTRATGLNQGGLENHLPQWKFVLGLNQESDGQYSAWDEQMVFGSNDPAQAAQTLVRQRLQAPAQELLQLAGRKITLMWGSFEELDWTMTNAVKTQIRQAGGDPAVLKQVTQRLCAGFYLWIFLLAGLGCGVAALWRDGRRNAAGRILMLAALAYFCVHLAIEIQSRYRTMMLALVLPLAALGIDWLCVLCQRRSAARDGGAKT